MVPFSIHSSSCCLLDWEGFEVEADMDQQAYTQALEGYLKSFLAAKGAKYAWGGFMEDRKNLYSKSPDFNLSEGSSRSIHLGVDLWAAAGTPVYAPYPGRIHSFQNNDSYGNYGPTLLLEHQTGDKIWYSLYGHLSKSSLIGLRVGAKVIAGEQIATLGKVEENVGWPPHLHFQIITDLLDFSGDYPGVAAADEKDLWASRVVDPAIVLR